MAVGTPEELESSIHGRKTVIQLTQVNAAILDSLKKLQVKNMTREDGKLTVDVVNPEEENPEMVAAIVAAGGRVETVTVTRQLVRRRLPETGKGEQTMTAWIPWKIARKELKGDLAERKASSLHSWASQTSRSCFLA